MYMTNDDKASFDVEIVDTNYCDRLKSKLGSLAICVFNMLVCFNIGNLS